MEIKGIEDLKFYVVQNSDGEFFHAIGYGGSGQTWVDDIKKAKVYTKIGQARSRVTYFANHFKSYPPPVILEITAGRVEILDEVERVRKAQIAKKKKEEEQKIRDQEWRIEQARTQIKKSQAVLDKYDKKD